MRPRERLRELIATPGCHVVPPIFDPLSARIAEMVGWEACKMSGSVGKFAALGVPDGVPMANMTDLAHVIRRITLNIEIPLIVDADDGGGNALTVRRTIRDLEAAGASAVELEDNIVPLHFIEERHAFMISKEEHVAKLKAAVATRHDPAMLIVGRTTAMYLLPMDEALDRIRAYSQTGVDALMLPGLGRLGLSPNPRADIEAVQNISKLPLFLSGLPNDLVNNEKWLTDNRVVLRFVGQAPYRNAVGAMYDTLKYMRDGGNGDDLPGASSEIRSELIREAELREWDETYTTQQ